MQTIHENLNLPTGSYEQPSGIVEAAVCSKSGQLRAYVTRTLKETVL
ncbi:MAG: hypothetical protein ACLR7D_10320 [Lachnospira eligens]